LADALAEVDDPHDIMQELFTTETLIKLNEEFHLTICYFMPWGYLVEFQAIVLLIFAGFLAQSNVSSQRLLN